MNTHYNIKSFLDRKEIPVVHHDNFCNGPLNLTKIDP